MQEDLIESIALIAEDILDDLYIMLPQDFNAFSGDKGIRISRADKHSSDAVSDNSVGAGRLFTVVAAGFEGDIHISAGAVDTAAVAVSEGVAFGVKVAAAFMPALTDHRAVSDDNSADHRVRADEAHTIFSQLQSGAHKKLVIHKHLRKEIKKPRNFGAESHIQREKAQLSSLIRTITVGSGITPDQPHKRLAGYTAGQESHPALKITIL